MFETGFVKKKIQGTFVNASSSFGKVTAGLVSAPTLWVPCVPPSCWLDVIFGGMFFYRRRLLLEWICKNDGFNFDLHLSYLRKIYSCYLYNIKINIMISLRDSKQKYRIKHDFLSPQSDLMFFFLTDLPGNLGICGKFWLYQLMYPFKAFIWYL